MAPAGWPLSPPPAGVDAPENTFTKPRKSGQEHRVPKRAFTIWLGRQKGPQASLEAQLSTGQPSLSAPLSPLPCWTNEARPRPVGLGADVLGTGRWDDDGEARVVLSLQRVQCLGQ